MSDPNAILLPNALAIEQALQVAGTNCEVLEYLDEAYRERLQKARMPIESSPILERIETLTEQVRAMDQMPLNIWQGERAGLEEKLQLIENYKANLAKEDLVAVLQQLEEQQASHIDMQVNMTSDAQFLRGYLIETGTVEPSFQSDQQPT